MKEEYPHIELTSKQLQKTTASRCFRCSMCDKIFYVPDTANWAYKLKNKHDLQRILCSWSCLRKADKILNPELYTVYD